MNRLRMRRLLWSGVSPVEVSIMKWKDIINEIGKDRATKNCGLCYKYNTVNCFQCPLQQIGKGCKDTDSPYGNYIRNKTHATVNGMIKALEQARVYELTGKKPVKKKELKKK